MANERQQGALELGGVDVPLCLPYVGVMPTRIRPPSTTPARGHSSGNLANRLDAAAAAKREALQRFQARPRPDDPMVKEQLAAQKAFSDARDIRISERVTARAAEAARQHAEEVAREAAKAAERAALEADKQKAADEAAARARALEAERKAARDARYAARKARR